MVHGEKKEKMRYSYILLTIFVCLSILVAGCTKSVDSDGSTDDVKNIKTEIEENQELIANFIADGSYSSDVTYNYHSGDETIKIDITVADDVITAASIASVGDTHKYSQQLIDAVNAELPNLVVGKKINEIQLPKNVAGSSLTTAAVQQHLEDLVEQY
jgi:major membrane immunogen (membrane-anchored lipoprotein)